MSRLFSRLLQGLLIGSLWLGAAVAAPPVAAPSVEDFLRRDSFGLLRLSPDGEHIAATVPLEDRTSLVIFRRSDMSRTGHVTLPAKSHVIDFYWVNPERILFTIGQSDGGLEAPRPTGEIYGVNVDGSGQGAPLIGFRSRQRGGVDSGSTAGRVLFASIIDTLPGDENRVLIATAAPGSPYTDVMRMDARTGRTSKVASAPVRRASFDTDTRGQVRFAAGSGSDNRVQTYYRDGDGSPWVLINDEAETQRIITPLGFSADGKTAYLQVEEENGPDAIYAFDTATRGMRKLLADDDVNPYSSFASPTDRSLYAVMFMDGKPRFEYLDPESPFAQAHRAIQAALPEQVVYPTSWTQDGRYGLFVGFSDRVPGDFYLFDREAGKLQYMVSRASWLKPEQLAETRPVRFTARDGLEIHGYLTLPPGTDGRNLPLVINPHGGPFGPFDTWGYEPERQLLASRGYAVFQVNFRGSGNYGRAFLRKGFRQWGGTMQDDLTDATQWAIAQGIADPRRICIYGASYGGYAALMGVVKEPTLYQCAIGNVGVYDMPLMFNAGDVPESRAGENYLREALGTTDLESVSPTRQAARIQVPVYLMAGREDMRAPPKHTELMYEALKALGKPVEMKIYAGEGHGNYLQANRIDFANRVLGFLAEHIGGTVTVGRTEATEAR
ncbi:S9 family peptidase [Silanimonas lenta]|uniref:S9 family peptidase n=1 Tax=Silanimonas lenta TaxID=265429 RepID=UPI002FE0BFBA